MGRSTGFIGSATLAIHIFLGSLRLLVKFPKLALPLFPVFLMLLAVEFGLLIIENLFVQLFIIFVVAFELMFSFVLTSNMLRQIHEGRSPGLIKAISSTRTLQLIPSVFLLSAIWYTIILALVAIEIAISALLDQEEEGEVVSSIFGTFADALRLMGFMLIPIMVFENTGLRRSFGRLRETLSEYPIVALGGLAATKLATAVIIMVIALIVQLELPVGFLGLFLLFAILGSGWILAISLEQLFVTGLYLYANFPESELVGLLLGKYLGRELPEISAQPAA